MSISDEINPKVSDRDKMPWDGSWRWTETIGCPGALLHIALGCESNGFSAETLALFGEGFLHEFDLKDRIRKAGYTVIDIEMARIPNLPVVLHPDGLLPVQEKLSYAFVLETKSVDDFDNPEQFIRDHPQYVKQVMGYMKALGQVKCLVVVKSRKTGWIADIEIDYDEVIIEPIVRNILAVKGLLDGGVKACDGPWAPGCSRDFGIRMFCPFYGVHCKSDEAIATAELDILLSKYAPAKVLSDEALSIVNLIREQIGLVMENEGINRIKALNGVSASMYADKRKYVDAKLLQEVAPDIYKKVTREGGNNVLRITIPKALRGNGVEVVDEVE